MFLAGQATTILAADFVHVDTAFIKHGTRRGHLAGITAHPTSEWVTQQQNPPAGRPHPPVVGANVRVLRRDQFGGLIREYTQVASGDRVFGTHRRRHFRSAPAASGMGSCPACIYRMDKSDELLPEGLFRIYFPK